MLLMDTLVEYAGPDACGGPVARLTLNSPHNRNALSTALVTQLHQGCATRPRIRRCGSWCSATPAEHSAPVRI